MDGARGILDAAGAVAGRRSAVATLAVLVVDPRAVQGVEFVATRVTFRSDTAQRTAGQGRSAHLDHAPLSTQTRTRLD